MSPCADAISRKRSRREEPSRLTLTLIATRSMPAASLLLFVGTYTSKDSASRGLYSVRLDSGTGALSQPVLAAEAANPTFLALHPAGRILYALGEIGPGPGAPGGGAVAYQIDSGTGRLAILNSQATGGGSGTHLAVDPAGKTLGFVSYGGGQVTSFPLANDGRIGPRATTQVPAGPLGPNPARQDKPHPHSVTFSPDGRFAYVCDLGLDRIFSYRIDSAALEPAGKVATAPGPARATASFRRTEIISTASTNSTAQLPLMPVTGPPGH